MYCLSQTRYGAHVAPQRCTIPVSVKQFYYIISGRFLLPLKIIVVLDIGYILKVETGKKVTKVQTRINKGFARSYGKLEKAF